MQDLEEMKYQNNNGTSLMWMDMEPELIIETDACLTGIGAVCIQVGQYITFPVPHKFKDYKIHHLEMWAILVALQGVAGVCSE